jgi:hypothetical protein
MADDFTRVHETTDPVEAEMLLDLLRQEGFDARLIGTRSAALIGASPAILPLRIEVPAEDAEEARACVKAVLDGGQVEAGEGGEDGADGEVEEPEVEREAASANGGRRSLLLAAGCTFVLPGGCHFYAGRPWSGAILAVGFVAALGFALLAAGERDATMLAALVMPALLACDLAAGLAAVRATNRGVRSSRARQIARGVVLVLVAGALAAGGALASALPDWLREAELARWGVTCSASSISIENRHDDARTVELTGVDLRVHDMMVLLAPDSPDSGGETWRLALEGSPVMELGPGERGTVAFTLDDETLTATGCARPGAAPPQGEGGTLFQLDSGLFPAARQVACDLAFELSAADDGEVVSGRGTCQPDWARGGAGAGRILELHRADRE